MIRPARAVVSLAAAVLAALAADARAIAAAHARALLQRLRGRGGAGGRARASTQKLKAFDDQTSSQIVVGGLPRAAVAVPGGLHRARRPGLARRAQQAEQRRGRCFVFVKDRKMRIETGYGLEGALPDATAHRIIDERIIPAFRNNDYAGGLEAGIDAMMAATRGEYTASPGAPPRGRSSGGFGSSFFLILLVLFIVIAMSRQRTPRTARTAGAAITAAVPGGGAAAGSAGGGGGFGGGGFGGGGGFSGGGGSFGGGGASGSW